jgi:hypothetical protein
MDKGHALNVLEGPLSTIRYVMDLLARDPDNPLLAAGEIISTGDRAAGRGHTLLLIVHASPQALPSTSARNSLDVR